MILAVLTEVRIIQRGAVMVLLPLTCVDVGVVVTHVIQILCWLMMSIYIAATVNVMMTAPSSLIVSS